MKGKGKCKQMYSLFLVGILICLSGVCISCGKEEDRVLDDPAVNEQESEELHSEGLQLSSSAEPLQVDSEKAHSQQDMPHSESGTEQSFLAKEAYKDVLLGNKEFINSRETGEGLENVNIEDITIVFTSDTDVTGKVTQFAIIDIDGDCEKEIILRISTGSMDEGFEVLRYQDGEIYGYHFWYRALECLAEDGTYIASGGASDTSVRKIRFLGQGYVVDTLYESRSGYNADGDFEIRYYANGEICEEGGEEEGECMDALSYQTQKSGIRWYDLTPENVEFVFENIFY